MTKGGHDLSSLAIGWVFLGLAMLCGFAVGSMLHEPLRGASSICRAGGVFPPHHFLVASCREPTRPPLERRPAVHDIRRASRLRLVVQSGARRTLGFNLAFRVQERMSTEYAWKEVA